MMAWYCAIMGVCAAGRLAAAVGVLPGISVSINKLNLFAIKRPGVCARCQALSLGAPGRFHRRNYPACGGLASRPVDGGKVVPVGV